MDAATEKKVKEELNEAKQSSDEIENEKDIPLFTDPNTVSPEHDNESQRALHQIEEIFQKTEEMKAQAKEKNKEIEDQFKDIKQRINSSSEYLHRIKKNIENIKFSYQKNLIDLQKNLDPGTEAANSKFESRDAMGKYMEEIREKIDELQNRMATQKEKQQQVTESYEEAFDKVVETLQQIDTGSYSSVNLLGDSTTSNDE